MSLTQLLLFVRLEPDDECEHWRDICRRSPRIPVQSGGRGALRVCSVQCAHALPIRPPPMLKLSFRGADPQGKQSESPYLLDVLNDHSPDCKHRTPHLFEQVTNRHAFSCASLLGADLVSSAPLCCWCTAAGPGLPASERGATHDQTLDARPARQPGAEVRACRRGRGRRGQAAQALARGACLALPVCLSALLDLPRHEICASRCRCC
jgi:hypothetical protein